MRSKNEKVKITMTISDLTMNNTLYQFTSDSVLGDIIKHILESNKCPKIHENIDKLVGYPLKNIPRSESMSMFHVFTMAWLATSKSEYFDIQQKLTKKKCELLKIWLKPLELTLEDGFSIYKNNEIKMDIYYVPMPKSRCSSDPYNYVPENESLDEIQRKTNSMREYRDRLIQQEKEKNQRKFQKAESKPKPISDWRVKPKNEEERKMKTNSYVPPHLRT